MRDQGVDVLIVGAGPSGSAAAIALAQKAPNLRIVLADRAVFPRDKSCGDGLGPGVVRVLSELDSLSAVQESLKPGAVLIGGPSSYEGYAKGPTVRGKDLSGFVLPRFTFDERLVSIAKAHGIEVIEGIRGVATRIHGNERVVDFETAEDELLSISAKFVIAADGAYSQMRKSIGVGRAEDQFTHIATRSYAHIRFNSDEQRRETPVRLDFEKSLLPAYAWVFPVSDNYANIGVGVPLTLFKQKKMNIQNLLQSYIGCLPDRGIEVFDFDVPLGHQLPHAGRMPKLVHERIALIGDAGSMINPFSGEGISYGMKAGLELARQFSDSFADPTSAASAWEKRFRREFRDHLKSCWLAHRFMRSERWAQIVIKASARDSKVIDEAAMMLFDEERMHPGTALRIVRAGVF